LSEFGTIVFVEERNEGAVELVELVVEPDDASDTKPVDEMPF
jgi:hypothetical protein